MDLKRTYASALIVALVAFLIWAAIPYVNGLFGAIILYTLFKPLYIRLTEKWRLGKTFSALSVIVFSIFLITLPFLYLMGLLVNEVKTAVSNVDALTKSLDAANSLFPGINLGDMLKGQLPKIGELIRDQIFSMILGFTHTIVNITIMYFIFYYMLVNHHNLRKIAASISPFNEKNTMRLAQEVSSVTKSTIIGQVAVGIGHGALLAAGFHFFGIPDPVFWGFVGSVLSMLPFFGTPMIWGPAGILKILSGNIYAGVGILVWGAILTNADSLMRPFIQLKVSRMHPLVSLIGFFIGVSYFGVLGIVVGPLLLSYSFLMLEMFKEEYLTHGHEPPAAQHKG
ncbi:MAG: AI-2E family transporter [Candidatus Altiarchaeota archaeon]